MRNAKIGPDLRLGGWLQAHPPRPPSIKLKPILILPPKRGTRPTRVSRNRQSCKRRFLASNAKCKFSDNEISEVVRPTCLLVLSPFKMPFALTLVFVTG